MSRRLPLATHGIYQISPRLPVGPYKPLTGSGLAAFLAENTGLADATMVADFKRWAFGVARQGEPLQAVPFNQLCDFSAGGERTYFDPNGDLQTAAAGVPRQDHEPATGETIGILLEKARTKILTHSDDLTAGDWVAPGTTISEDTGGYLLIEDTSNGVHMARSPVVSCVSGTTYTAYAVVEANGRDQFDIHIAPISPPAFGRFTLTGAGSVELGSDAETARIKSLGGGVYFCEVTATATSDADGRVSLRLFDGSSSSYAGDGSSGIKVYYVGLEAGNVATSHLPVAGTPLTRAAETLTLKQVGTWVRESAGTLIVRSRSRTKRPASVVGLAQLSDASGSGLIRLSSADDSDDYEAQIVSDAGATVFDDGVTEANSGSDLVTMTTSAIAWDSTGAIVAANGHANSEDTSVTLPTGLDEAVLGDGSEAFLWIEWAAFISRKLSSSELQSITA